MTWGGSGGSPSPSYWTFTNCTRTSSPGALRAVFERNDLAYALICAGAFFAYVRHPFAGTPAVDVAQRLILEENVLCLPGSAFGPDQDGYLRFALANIDGEAMALLGDRLVASQR